MPRAEYPCLFLQFSEFVFGEQDFYGLGWISDQSKFRAYHGDRHHCLIAEPDDSVCLYVSRDLRREE